MCKITFKRKCLLEEKLCCSIRFKYEMCSINEQEREREERSKGENFRREKGQRTTIYLYYCVLCIIKGLVYGSSYFFRKLFFCLFEASCCLVSIVSTFFVARLAVENREMWYVICIVSREDDAIARRRRKQGKLGW